MKEKENQSLYSALLYGVINALMVTPVSISFCAIIFCHPAFLPHLPQLVKLVLFSSAMHQLCFTLCSSLPFAVGQVQDAGLIFLSAMAASIAKGCQASGQADALLPTTLVVLALCTAALGLLLIATAKLRLASFVQYLPMPVVGGYLAFIGFFCGEAGLAMMANVTIHTKADWLQFLDPQVAKLYLPGLAGGVSIYLLLRRLRNPFVLPACMAAILALFYLAVYASGYSLDEMREAGWISPLTPSESALDAWKLYDISQVDWHYLPSQLPSLLALYLVVAFSSSLDIAAIEMELGLPLDYNTELFTVGVANLASGCLGGYTGSYIFSQTLFTLRNGVGSRAAGWVVVLVELLFVVLPFPVFAYLPKLFFGSLLVFISADLLCEWLVAARRKMGGADYLLCLASFLAIQCYGIEVGMALGVVAAMMAFVARVAGRPRHTLLSVTTLPCSTVVRTFEERAVLIANRGKIVSIELKGYIFFGTAVRVLEEIVSRIDVHSPPPPPPAPAPATATAPPSQSPAGGKMLATSWMGSAGKGSAAGRAEEQEEEERTPLLTSPSSHEGDCVGDKRDYGSRCSATSESSPSSVVGGGGGGGLGSRGGEVELTLHMMTPSHCHPALASSPPPPAPALSRVSSANGSNAFHSPLRTVYEMSAQEILDHYEAHHYRILLLDGEGETEEKQEEEEEEKGRKPPPSVIPFPIPPPPPAATGLPPPPPPAAAAATDLPPAPPAPSQAVTTKSSIPSYDNSHSSVMGWPRGAMDARHPLQALPLPSSTTEGVRRVLGNAHLHLSTDSRDLLANRGLAAAPPTSTSWAVGEEVASSGSGAVGLPAASSDTFALSLEEPQEKEEEEEESNRLHRLAVDQLLASSRDDTPQEVQKHLGRPPLAPSSSSCSSSHSGSFSKASLPRPSGLKAYHSSYADMQSLLANPPPPPPPAPVASISSSRDAMNDSETQPAEEEEQEEVHTEYLILDCSQLLGIDATAARSCFRSLVNLLREARVVVVFAQLSSEVEQLLRAHDVVTKQAVVISHLDDAIEWCENQVLLSNVKRLRRGLERSLSDAMGRGADHFSAAHHLRQAQLPSRSSSSLLALPSSPSLRSLPTHLSSSSTTDDPLRPLRIILKDYLEVGSRSSSSSFSSSLYSSLQRGRGLRDYFQQEVFVFQEVIFEVGQASDKVFFIEKGTVEIVAISPAHVSRVNKVCAGGAFGEADFFLGRRHAVRALASSHEGETVCWTISRDAFAAMRRDHPDLFVAVQHSLCKSLSIAATWSMFALHPTTASLSDYPPPPATTIESMV